MKTIKKILEVEFTNIDSTDKYSRNSYGGNGFYLNIDENRFAELFCVNGDLCNSMFLESNYSMFFQDELEVVQEDQSGKVSEDFALKMIAIVANKEKIKEIE